jgi:hypothetical protein
MLYSFKLAYLNIVEQTEEQIKFDLMSFAALFQKRIFLAGEGKLTILYVSNSLINCFVEGDIAESSEKAFEMIFAHRINFILSDLNMVNYGCSRIIVSQELFSPMVNLFYKKFSVAIPLDKKYFTYDLFKGEPASGSYITFSNNIEYPKSVVEIKKDGDSFLNALTNNFELLEKELLIALHGMVLIETSKESFTIAFKDAMFSPGFLESKETFFKALLNKYLSGNHYFVSKIGQTQSIYNFRYESQITRNRLVLETLGFIDQDIPEEFMCRLTAQIMSLPVKIDDVYVDQKILDVQRSMCSENPFNRQPIPITTVFSVDEELKRKIDEFVNLKLMLLFTGKVDDIVVKNISLQAAINSPYAQAGVERARLMQKLIVIIGIETKAFDPLLRAVRDGLYGKALRCACTGTTDKAYLVIEALLEKAIILKIDINEADTNKKMTALHHAAKNCKNDDTKIYDLLVRHGANESSEDINKVTPSSLMVGKTRCTVS